MPEEKDATESRDRAIESFESCLEHLGQAQDYIDQAIIRREEAAVAPAIFASEQTLRRVERYVQSVQLTAEQRAGLEALVRAQRVAMKALECLYIRIETR
jgi:hypothetical protein